MFHLKVILISHFFPNMGVFALWNLCFCLGIVICGRKKASSTSFSCCYFADTRPLLCFSADTVPIRALAWAPFERLLMLENLLFWVLVLVLLTIISLCISFVHISDHNASLLDTLHS